MNKFPVDIKEKWLTALRSGEYKQGKYYLKNDNNCYCCLGVLQMVLDGEVECSDAGESYAVPTYVWCQKHDIALECLMGVQKVPNNINKVNLRSHMTLVDMNDFYDFTFEDIAKVIEHNL